MATVAFGGVAAGRECASMTRRTWTYAQMQRHGRISARQPKRPAGPCAVNAILSPEATFTAREAILQPHAAGSNTS